MIGSHKFTNVRLATFSSFSNLYVFIYSFLFDILGLGIALIKVAETEADQEIETKTDEKADVSPAKRRVIKLETAKKDKEEEEEGLDLDLTPGLIEECTVEEETHVPILEIGEDQEEETLETEDRDLLILEIEDNLETLETAEETIEAWVQDHHLIANIADLRENRSQGEKPLKTDVQEVDLLAKVILKPEQWKEKVFQEVILKEE